MSVINPDQLAVTHPERGPSGARRLRFTRPGLLRALWRSRNGRIGVVLVGIIVLAALLPALGLTPYPPQAQDPNAVLKGVSASHLFGTDQFGRDVFSLVLEGIGVSLEIACIATLIAGTIGTLGGIVAGYLGGFLSTVILRATDIVFAIPAILLALAIVTALGPGILDSALAIGLLPRLPQARLRQVGNAAGVGAKATLLSLRERARAGRIAHRTGYMELTSYPAFQRRFAHAMLFPAIMPGRS